MGFVATRCGILKSHGKTELSFTAVVRFIDGVGHELVVALAVEVDLPAKGIRGLAGLKWATVELKANFGETRVMVRGFDDNFDLSGQVCDFDARPGFGGRGVASSDRSWESAARESMHRSRPSVRLGRVDLLDCDQQRTDGEVIGLVELGQFFVGIGVGQDPIIARFLIGGH